MVLRFILETLFRRSFVRKICSHLSREIAHSFYELRVTTAWGTPFSTVFLLMMLGNLGPIRSQSTDERLQVLTAKAQAAQRSGNLEEAVKAYEEILSIHSRWGPVEFNLGLMYHLQKRYFDAIRLFTAALKDDSTLAPAYLFRGVAYFNTGQYEKALSSLQRFLQLQPTDREVRFFLAGTYFALEDYRKASLQYLEQMKIAPQNEELYYHLGECYLALARQELKKLGEAPGGHYFLRLISAEAHIHEKDDSGAEQFLLDALKSNPAAPEAYISLGQLLFQRGNLAAARTKFEDALKRNPRDCRALEGLADTDMAMGNIETALESLQQVLTRQPLCLEDPPPENLGLPPGEFELRIESLNDYVNSPKWKNAAAFQLFRLKGRREEKSAGGSEVTHSQVPCRQQATPNRHRATSGDLLLRANCLESHDDLRGATVAMLEVQSRSSLDLRTAYWTFRLYTRLSQKSLARLMSLAPNSYLLAMMRAQISEQQGKDKEAEAEYYKALALAEHAPDPLIEYARIKCKQSLFQEAIPSLEKALKLDPHNVKANALLGEVYHLNNKPETAIPYLQVAVKARSQDEQSRTYLAHSLASVGQIQEAIEILEAAPSDSDGRIHYALGTYYRRQGRTEDAARALQIFEQRRNKRKPLGIAPK